MSTCCPDPGDCCCESSNISVTQDPLAEKVLIDKNFLEHLLNCLANQRYVHEFRSDEKEAYQKIIDDAWDQGMKILEISK